RIELAACLPTEASHALTRQNPDPQQVTGRQFVKDLASRTGTTPATARWDTGAVLTAVGHLAGNELIGRVIGQLPDGYALLFGRAQLVRAA
ncbi:DUF2267 domain-containing protein, partial [Streptomyces sp. NPDC005386]|uniref:DUF2267 domain-containing protein n=1 Tax=Streptomyces sp. NPDC005386 TaxID=3154562 RepID=UPI0033BC63DB